MGIERELKYGNETVEVSPEASNGRSSSADCTPDIVVCGLCSSCPVHDRQPGEGEGLRLDPGEELGERQLALLVRELMREGGKE